MKITIIGGGAAGMMAAVSASYANPSAKVWLLERNTKLGRKVVISGGGRCNLTTGTTDIHELMKNYPRGNKWLKFAMHSFSPQDCYDYFEEHGIPLKIEGNRVFPKSNNGEDVVEMFLKIFKERKVEIMYKKVVQNIEKDGDLFVIKLDNGTTIKSDKTILATGGSAYSQTGSQGDGYEFAKSLGHTITKLAPTLTSLNSNEKFIKSLAGVSTENAKLKLVAEQTYEFTGPFLFTHKGVTGPAVFAISAFSAYENLKKGVNKKDVKLFIDFVPSLNREQLRSEITKNPKKLFIRVISRYVTKSLAEVFQIDKEKRVNEISKKEIAQALELLKNFPILITGRTAGREIVTAGGVNLEEINKKTMESLITPGLYFAGELLDVDGLTGGYNLQIAWATGKLSGERAVTIFRG